MDVIECDECYWKFNAIAEFPAEVTYDCAGYTEYEAHCPTHGTLVATRHWKD